MQFEEPHIVYVKTNSSGHITAVNSSAFLVNSTAWTEIDRGYGDKYHHAQGNYFDGGLYTEDGICRWKYADGQCVLRSDAEIEEDRAEIPAAPSQPTNEERIAELEEALELLLSGVTE